MSKNDVKERLREEYLINKKLIERYLINDNDFDSGFHKARKRNGEIVEYLHRVFNMDYDTIIEYLR